MTGVQTCALPTAFQGGKRRPKVDQADPSVGRDQDIIRRDVAMKETGVMERVQRVHDWVQDPERFVVSEFPILLFQIRFQRRTGNIFHDDIRGPVFAEKVVNVDDDRIRTEAREVFGLTVKGFNAFQERFTVLRIGGDDFPVSSRYKSVQEVFLNRDFTFQVQVEAKVGDPETALAEDLPDQVFSAQDRSRRQREPALRRRLDRRAANGSDRKSVV